MSVENELKRIADALETLVGLKTPTAPSIEPKGEPAPLCQTKDKKDVKVETPRVKVEKKEVEAPKEITLAELEPVLRLHCKQFGAEVTKKLMEKYGATTGKPTMASIPVKSYADCYAEAKSQIKE